MKLVGNPPAAKYGEKRKPMQTLNQFVKEQIDDIKAFQAFWMEQNRLEGRDKFPHAKQRCT